MQDRTDNPRYFRYRAEQELELAQNATLAEAVTAHCQLAEAYLKKAEEADAQAKQPSS